MHLLFIIEQIIHYWENLAQTLPISLRISSPSVLLFTYNFYSKQLILLVVKKPDARFLPPCPKHRFVVEDMIEGIVRFPPMWEANIMYEQIDSGF